MQQKNALIQLILDFVTELVTRLKSKSPKIFVWLQRLSVVVVALTGLPDAINWVLDWLPASIHFQLPSWATALSSKVAAIAAVVAWFISKLPISAKTEVSDSSLPISNK